MLVVEIWIKMPYFILREVQFLLLNLVFPREPIVKFPKSYKLVDQGDNLHVVLAPISVHVFDLYFDYFGCVLSYLWHFTFLKLSDKSFHDYLYSMIKPSLQQLYIGQDSSWFFHSGFCKSCTWVWVMSRWTTQECALTLSSCHRCKGMETSGQFCH